MKATIVFLARDRTTVMQHMGAGLKGREGIQPAHFYDVVAALPLHETGDFNVLLAAIDATCMTGQDGARARNYGLPRAMVPGDLVVFDDGPVFLADVADRWTMLDEMTAAPFRELVKTKETSWPG